MFFWRSGLFKSCLTVALKAFFFKESTFVFGWERVPEMCIFKFISPSRVGWGVFRVTSTARPPFASSMAPSAPMDGARQELQAFQILQSLRNTGQISPADYQRLVMELAGGHNVRILANEPLSISPPHAEGLQPPPPLPKGFKPVPVSPQAVSLLPPLPKSLKPLQPNPLTQIQRPAAGPIRLVHTKDVAPF